MSSPLIYKSNISTHTISTFLELSQMRSICNK